LEAWRLEVWRSAAKASRNMRLSKGQCRPRGSAEGGKFCRCGIICREIAARSAAKVVVLTAFFLWHTAC
jgi:hypothetical protein